MITEYLSNNLPSAETRGLQYISDREDGTLVFSHDGRWHFLISKKWIHRPEEYIKFMFYGQSLSILDGYENIYLNHDNLKRVGVDYVAMDNGLDISEISSNAARSRYPSFLDGYKIISDSNGLSGFSITQLNKGNSYYTNLINNAKRDRDTIDFKVAAVVWFQGESNALDTIDIYYPLLQELFEDIKEDIKTEAVQDDSPKIFTYQMAYKSLVNKDIALSHLKASNEIEDCFLVCPMYFFPYSDGVHPTPEGGNWVSEYLGRALYLTSERKVEPYSTKVLSVSRDGANLDLLIKTPFVPIVIDQITLGAIQDEGIHVSDDGVTQSINSVSVVGDDIIRVTLDSVPTGTVRVRYGFDYTSELITASDSGGGCIRDSDPETRIINGISKNMYNWLAMFDIEV